MSENLNGLYNVLSENGHSFTKARKSVFTELRSCGPLSMNELVNRLASQVDRVSVYRVVKLFEQLQIVNRVQLGWKYKLELSDEFVEHHHHIQCSRCDTLVAIEHDNTLENVLTKLAHRYNFDPVNHRVELVGICSSCKQ